MKDLSYNGRVMVWAPSNIDVDALLDALIAGKQVHVRLEPGDATRYDLLVTWLPSIRHAFYVDEADAREGLLVQRTIGGDIVGSDIYAWFTDEGVARIANGNEWSAELLAWWLELLVRQIAAREGRDLAMEASR